MTERRRRITRTVSSEGAVDYGQILEQPGERADGGIAVQAVVDSSRLRIRIDFLAERCKEA